MPYPSAGDLEAFLLGRGIKGDGETDALLYADAVAAAATAWERDTHWTPFLAGAEETRVFDGPEGRVLHLPVGVVSISDLTIGGYAYTVDSDYFLQHRFGGTGPYTAIEFGGYHTGARRLVSITGVFGYQIDLDAQVKQAILAKAAADFIGFEDSGAVSRYSAGPVTYQYDLTAGRGRTDRLAAMYEEAVRRYRRPM
jgi:hypothetical protein